jgi:CBS domain-containing protein
MKERIMKISQLMTPHPVTCTASTNLAEAAALMLEGDCGILPVLSDGKLFGVVTDRDLFIALGTRDLRPSSMTVADVVTGPVFTCGPDDEPETVLALMKEHQIRRLPVLGFGGTVLGIVSMNDLALAAGKPGVRGADILTALQAICAHHHPTPHIEAA